MKPLTSISLDIKGRSWCFKLFTDRAFDRLHNPNDEGNAGMTLPNIYEVHFAKSEWDTVDIRHEIMHLLYHMSLTGSAEHDPSQVEETMCEITATHYHEIGLWSDRVTERFLNYHKT